MSYWHTASFVAARHFVRTLYTRSPPAKGRTRARQSPRGRRRRSVRRTLTVAAAALRPRGRSRGGRGAAHVVAKMCRRRPSTIVTRGGETVRTRWCTFFFCSSRKLRDARFGVRRPRTRRIRCFVGRARAMQIVSAGRVTTAGDADAPLPPKRERGDGGGGGGGVWTRAEQPFGGQVSVALVGPRVHLARVRGPTFRAPGARVRPDERRRAGTRIRVTCLLKCL